MPLVTSSDALVLVADVPRGPSPAIPPCAIPRRCLVVLGCHEASAEEPTATRGIQQGVLCCRTLTPSTAIDGCRRWAPTQCQEA